MTGDEAIEEFRRLNEEYSGVRLTPARTRTRVTVEGDHFEFVDWTGDIPGNLAVGQTAVVQMRTVVKLKGRGGQTTSEHTTSVVDDLPA